jgi:hypothetical protein
MSDATPRFALPFILPGQAQKEAFHNEALLRIDAMLSPSAEGPPRSEPPANPDEGECWIVAEGASGAWAGKAHSLACWTGAGWRHLPPRPGTTVWNKADAVPLQWNGSGWSTGAIACGGVLVGGQQVVGERQPAVASPSGGTIIDAEARSALNALIATLMSHGLID